MPSIMITCTRTGRAISTGIDTDPVTFLRIPNVVATTHCPLCQADHTWTAARAWICDCPPVAGQVRPS
jgi:hypothetical protein